MTPQFFKIILSPHASKLHIPDEFVAKYGADLRDVVFLEVPSGAIWEVKLQNSNGMKWLKGGWNKFKEYYSIGCGYFLLFKYNGNSHFSVFIFDLSASEIEYPCGPNEDMTPQNFVNIVGDSSHRKKADGLETQNKACDDDFLRNKTAEVTKVADCSYSESRKSGIPLSGPSCLPERQELNRVKLEIPDVEEDLNYATQKDKRKEIKEKLVKQNMEKNLYYAADKGSEHCNEVLDLSASKLKNTTKCNKRKYSISLEASRCRYALRSKQVKLEQFKENGWPSYSGKQRPSSPLSCRVTQSKITESNRENLEKANSEESKGNYNEVPVVDASACKVATPNQHSKKKTGTSLDASNCRYSLRSKQLKEVKIEKGDVEGLCSEVPIVDASPCMVPTTDRHSEKRSATSLDASNCRYPLRSKKLKEVKIDKGDAEGHCSEVPIVDASACKVTTAAQHSKKKTATNLVASICRYPLRSKQLKEVKMEKGDVEEHCKEISMVDPSATKVATINRHHKKKTIASLNTSHYRYPLRSKQLKEVKLEEPSMEEDLLYVAQKSKRKKANNAKLEKGEVEERCKEISIGPSETMKTPTNRHHDNKTGASLDASHCRYSLQSKQLKEVKLEQWKAGGNIHNRTPRNIVADSPYCKRQNSVLPSSSPSCQPIRVKLEKPDNLFCVAEKAKGQETNNVKFETGDMEGNLNSAAYKGKDSTASEMTNTCQEKDVTLREAQLGSAYFNPYFIVSMQPAYVSRNYQLDIPVKFFKTYIKDKETVVILRLSDGRTWRSKLFIQSNCAEIQSSGWRDFVLDNSLKEHDTCVFELIDGIERVLDVTIFRA